MTAPVARDVLWSHTDEEADTARMLHGPFNDDKDALGHLMVWDGVVNLDHDAVRRLRNACDRLLTSTALASTGAAHPAPEAPAVSVHAEQHQRLEAAARRIGEQLSEHTTALARVAGRAQELPPLWPEPEVYQVLGQLAVQQQRVAASLGDLLAALAGEA
jgi:hypothetical protein